MRLTKLAVCSSALLFASIATFPQTPVTPKPATYQVKFVTTRGEFTVTVTRAWAPFGADRFYNLVKHHYYDGARVYRVIPGFVAQFGINAHPPVNAAWAKATIKDDPV